MTPPYKKRLPGVCPEAINSADPVSRVLYSAETEPLSFIYNCDHSQLPATYPSTSGEQPLIVDIHGLATHEAYCRGVLLPSRWALTPPFHPYLPEGRRSFSVTLLHPHGHQVVSLRGALCCSDFPPPSEDGSDRACLHLSYHHSAGHVHMPARQPCGITFPSRALYPLFAAACSPCRDSGSRRSDSTPIWGVPSAPTRSAWAAGMLSTGSSYRASDAA